MLVVCSILRIDTPEDLDQAATDLLTKPIILSGWVQREETDHAGDFHESKIKFELEFEFILFLCI